MNTVALPIETKVRELHGKLWLGLHLLERGHDVVLGPSWEVDVTLYRTQPDAYISQGPSDSKIERFDRLRQAGIRVYGLAPESGIGAPIERFISNKKQIVNHLDGFLCWGEKQSKELSKHHDNTENIHITGNPRFDLQYDQFRAIYNKKVTDLRKEHSRFVLLNTNFGTANAFDQDLTFEQLDRLFNGVEIEELRHEKRTFYSFLESILYLSENLEEHDLIIRPHPAENHDMYIQALKPYQNIKVIYSGDAREWIAAAELVMHHDCTTGIESVLIGTPVLSYRPIDSQSSGKDISQAVSNEVFERGHLVEKIQSLVSDQPVDMSEDQKQILRPYFRNIDSCAATAICDVIEQHQPKSSKNYQMIKPSTWELIETHARATKWSEQATEAYDIVRQFVGSDSLKKMRERRQQKFPGLAHHEITETIENMTGETEPSFSVENVSGTNSTFIISPE